MPRLLRHLPVVVLTAACSATDMPVSPTSTPSSVASSAVSRSIPRFGTRSLEGSDPSWSPWFYPQWQPSIGEPLGENSHTDSIVEAGEICVPNLRWVWDARSSCKRFLISVSGDGWLQASLQWDTSAPGFDESLAGEVVLVAPDGRMASSAWQRARVAVRVPVQRGDYGALVMTYVPENQPFQLRIEHQSR
jgi:hypothetical protein